MNIYLIIILAALVAGFVVECIGDFLCIRSLDMTLPDEFKGMYEPERYARSQQYTRSKAQFDCISSAFSLVFVLTFILAGGFSYVDRFVRGLDVPTTIAGLIFFGILFLIYEVFSIPFSLYNHFVIEERFGFNTMTLRTFFIDKAKMYLLVCILGSIILGGMQFIFERAGSLAWLYVWAFVSIFILIAQPLYTMVIAPLFNDFIPLEEGGLKGDIERYAARVRFPLKEISVMDGSRRSAHSNAYFSGLYKKRIALFDTLLNRHSPEEIVAVIAHEVGHYKKRHVVKGMVWAILHTGVFLYLLSIFMDNLRLFQAFGVQRTSVYAGFVFFAFLYLPVEFVISVLMNHISRKHELEADTFAAQTTGSIEGIVSALKNLAVSNLGNLTPHPLNVVLRYTHPPVLDRIAALRSMPL
ncbi:MAG: M48 family metallopeptidase [bacterium]